MGARLDETVTASGTVTMPAHFAEPGTGADGTFWIDADIGGAALWGKGCFVWDRDVCYVVKHGILIPAEQPLCGAPDPPTSQDGRGFWWLTEVEEVQAQGVVIRTIGWVLVGVAIAGMIGVCVWETYLYLARRSKGKV